MTKARSNASSPNTKGDLIVGTGTGTASALGVGSDGQLLTAASGQTSGLQWTTVTASPVFPATAGVSYGSGGGGGYNTAGAGKGGLVIVRFTL